MNNAHLKYNSFNELLKKKFNEKVWRLSLNLGLTCPNKDGDISTEGCYFCSDDHLLGKSWHKQQNLDEQIKFGQTYLKERHKARKYLAYFQNGTNTNATAATLKPFYQQVIKHQEVVGLIISTRSDCLDNKILDLLSEMNEQTWLWVELGLQSTQDHVLNKINRGHTVANFIEATQSLAKRNILNCCHIILGLPDESRQEMIDGVKLINSLPINGIKLHNLFITKNTTLAKWYEAGKVTPLELQEYASLCVDYLEHLRPDIVVHRLNAHAPDRYTLAPKWSVNKWGTLNAVHAEILKRDTWQGRLYQGSSQKKGISG